MPNTDQHMQGARRQPPVGDERIAEGCQRLLGAGSQLQGVGSSAVTGFRGTAVTPEQVLDDAAVVFESDQLVYVGPADALPPSLQGADYRLWEGLILPGLVDIHCHGGGGASFPDALDPAEAMRAVMEHRRHGTTSLVASLVTDSKSVLLARVGLLAALAADGELAGIHLEGPFLSAARCGAQDPSKMALPDVALVEALAAAGRGFVASMTLAPELPGVRGQNSVIAALARLGVVPSFGHTDALAEVVEAAIDEGLAALADAQAGLKQAAARAFGAPVDAGEGTRMRLVPTATHLFNGMRPIHHRDPGPVPALLAAARRGQTVVELVADGVHLAPTLVREVFELVGGNSVALVTDAMAAAGMPDGSYRLGPQSVRVGGGVARLEDGGAIAGGTAHLLDVVRCTVQQAGVDLAVAVKSASLVPALTLGLAGRVGALRTGWRADVLLTDSSLRPKLVYRAGLPI